MTVIAWDGKTLAADKQCTNFGYGSTVTKIFRVDDAILALAGCEPHALAILNWFQGDRDPAKWPKPFDIESVADVLVVTAEGIFKYCGLSPYPAKCEDKFFAIGSGRDFALAAMYLGKNAREAVEVACALDIQCGNGIDTLEL